MGIIGGCGPKRERMKGGERRGEERMRGEERRRVVLWLDGAGEYSVHLDHGSWIMDHGSWIMEYGSRIMEYGLWMNTKVKKAERKRKGKEKEDMFKNDE